MPWEREYWLSEKTTVEAAVRRDGNMAQLAGLAVFVAGASIVGFVFGDATVTGITPLALPLGIWGGLWLIDYRRSPSRLDKLLQIEAELRKIAERDTSPPTTSPPAP